MPGFEIIGEEERKEINEIFDKGGCLFRYGFDFMRSNSYKVVDFEKNFAEFVQSQYCQATTSGTTALFAINKALGIKRGDEVITQAFTFIATVEAIMETGATPVIAEIDSSYNLDPEKLESLITEKTKAIWVVHMMGGPANMEKILRIGEKYNIKILEDSAQALGAQYNGKQCGTLGYAGAFSFDFGKTLTTGEGGMASTNDKSFYNKLKEYCDHGHQDNPKYPRGEDTASKSGFNFRMMELQGAVGLAQLKKMPEAFKRIKQNRNIILNELNEFKNIINLRHTPLNGSDAGDTLLFNLNSINERLLISDYLTKKNIGFKLLPGAVKWHFAGRWDHILDNIPKYCGKNYLELWPTSYDLLQRSIAIPIMINMKEKDIDLIVKKLTNALKLIK